MNHLDRSLALRLGAVAAAALAAAVVVGGLVGFAVAATALTGSSSNDGWAAFGAAMLGIAVGVAVATVAYTTVVAVGVRRVVPEGRRAGTITGLIMLPPLLLATAGVADGGALAPLGVAGALGLLVAAVVAVLALAGALDVAPAVRLGGGAAGVAVVCVALSVLLHPAAQRAELRDAYRRSGAPVALVDGATLDAPSPGWRLHSVDHPRYGGEASVTWEVRGSYVQLKLLAQPAAGACPHAQLGWVCERLGSGPAGAAAWGERLPEGTAMPGYENVWVDVDGGRWQLAGLNFPQPLDGAEAVQVLSRLEAVDIDRYVAVANRR